MRCPKCHYLSFEPEARCRNCGYDLALSDDDLVIQAEDLDGPLQDFDLHLPTVAAAPVTRSPMLPVPDREERLVIRSAEPARPPAPVAPLVASPIVAGPRPVRPPSTSTELPLFLQGLPAPSPEPGPLQAPVLASSRPPLAVRRRSVESGGGPPRVERSTIADMAANIDSVWAPLPATVGLEPDLNPGPTRIEAAAPDDRGHGSMGARVLAGAIDFALLGAIDAIVLWFTVRICTLTFGEVLTLPLVPLIAFFLLIDIGYLLLFTATSGQTLGKMAAGLRVVAGSEEHYEERLSLRQAFVRSLATVPSVVALGAGFLPALGQGGLTLHDRLSHTRVVRA